MDALVRERLRNGGIDRFVDLLIEDVLSRPVRELADPAWIARQLAATARTAAADPQVEVWLRARIRDARGRVPAGPVEVPPELREPLRALLSRPYVPDRELVGALLDHDTARLLLRNLFQDLLIAFGRKLRPAMQMAPRAPIPSLRGLQKLGEGVLGVVGQELEVQLEQRAREFMDAGVQRLVDKMADHLCDPKLSSEYGSWRRHVLDVLGRTDARKLAAEVEKLDPESLVATGAALVRGLAGREELVGQLEAVIRAAMDAAGDRSVRALLTGEGSAVASTETLDTGVEALRDVLRERGRALVETEAFEAWWDEVNGA